MKQELNELNEALNSTLSKVGKPFKFLPKLLDNKLGRAVVKNKFISLFIVFVSMATLVYIFNTINKVTNKFELVVSQKPIKSDVIIDSNKLQDRQQDLSSALKKLKSEKLLPKDMLKEYNVITKKINSLSYFNLGISKLRQKSYQEALTFFKKSIQTEQYRFVSSINAAVTSLYLGNEKLFNYYIGLASLYLSEEVNNPNFKYYYGILNYYKGNYLAVVASLTHNKTFITNSNTMLTKSFLAFNDYYDAVDTISNNKTHDYLNTGILYAKIGEYDLAIKELSVSMKNPKTADISKLLLFYIYLKDAKYSNIMKLMPTISKQLQANMKKRLPIKIVTNKNLSNNIYNFKKIQSILDDPLFKIQLMAYFTNYKMIGDENLINSLNKIKNSSDEKLKNRYLQMTMNSSKADIALQKAINLIEDKQYYKAKGILEKAYKKDKNNAVLNYNLALLYLNIGNSVEAYKHFLISFKNDQKNITAGIFAKLLSDYLRRDSSIITKIVSEDINSYITDGSLKQYYLSFLNLNSSDYYQNNWLKLDKNAKIQFLMLDIILEYKTNKDDALKKLKIVELGKKNILTAILKTVIKGQGNKYREYVKKSIEAINSYNISLKDIYSDSYIVRDLFTTYFNTTLRTASIESDLNRAFSVEQTHFVNLAKMYAYTLLLDKSNDAVSKDIYNTLIDKYGVDDTSTLLKTALISLRSGDSANAIILIRTALNKDSKNEEALYALALTFIKIGDISTATTYINKLQDGFKPKYFDFEMVHND